MERLPWLIVLAVCLLSPDLVSGKSLGKLGEKTPTDSKTIAKKPEGTTTATSGKTNKPKAEDVKLSFNTKKGSGGNCTVNCTITFDNDDNSISNDGEPLNLMDENDKMEESAQKQNVQQEDTAKRHDKAEYNGTENDDSSGEPDEDMDDSEMVEADTHMGNENSAASGDSTSIKDAPTSNAVEEKGAGKNKQVSVTPQSSVQEGTKLPVSDMSNATQHPSIPIPQMIPLPLFYNSGDTDGSANGMTKDDTKKTGDIDEINGESGYGELFASNSSEPQQQQQQAQVSQVPHVTEGKPLKTKHTRVHLHAGKKVEVGTPDVAPAVVAQINPAGDVAPSGPNTFAPHVDTALSAGKPGGETTTDYPFVVSDGPKANIHPLRNSKIKMGNDHDEDLVDYYDDDEESDDSPAVAPLTDDAGDEGEGDANSEADGESGDSAVDSADTAPKLDEENNAAQPPQEAAGEASGSGSGEADFSGSDAAEDKSNELEEPPKPKKNRGKKIKTKTFEFGVGELGGNNLPIVVPVISKHPKDGDDEKKNDKDVKDVKKNKAKAKSKSAQAFKEVTKNADVAATAPSATPNAAAAPPAAPAAPGAPAAPNATPNVAAAAKEIDLNELTLEEARNLMHEEAKTLLLADQAKVLKEKEQALKKEEEALRAQEEVLKQQAIKEAKALKEQKVLMEQKKLQEKALQDEAIKVKKLKDDALKEEEKAKALLKEKKKEEEKEEEEKEAKTAGKKVKGAKGKSLKGKSKTAPGQPPKLDTSEDIDDAESSKSAVESKKNHEEWIVNMKGAPASPLSKPAAEISAMKLPGAPPVAAVKPVKPSIPAQFLFDGLGSKIAGEIGKLTSQPLAAPGAAVAAATPPAVPSTCIGLCLQSCSDKCPPECCGRSGFPLKNGVTAQILPIPEDLNKVIKDAGLGPGTTAQILPNEQNKHMLQQAGFADGVTARIIPIPSGYQVSSTPEQGVGQLNRSPAEPAKLTITAPKAAKASPAPANKESAQPPHPPLAAFAARTAPQPNLNPLKPAPGQPPKAVAPPPVAALQPPRAVLPPLALGRAAQEASARLDVPPPPNAQPPLPAAKAAKVPSPPPAKPPAGSPQATITTLPDGEKNYDETVYRELLAQLPPSVAPEENGFTPLTVTQQLHQINVPEQAAKLRKFFKGVKTQPDPFSNLEAYKRQEFKNYDQILVDDR